MRTEITPGQTYDYLGFDLVMADNLPSPSVLLAVTPPQLDGWKFHGNRSSMRLLG